MLQEEADAGEVTVLRRADEVIYPLTSDLRALVGLRVALVAGRWLGPTAIRNSKWSDRCNNIEGI